MIGTTLRFDILNPPSTAINGDGALGPSGDRTGRPTKRLRSSIGEHAPEPLERPEPVPRQPRAAHPGLGGEEQHGCHHIDARTQPEPEPSLLSFTWISAATDLRPTIVTVELHERDGGTELVLTHRRLPAEGVDAHRRGWTDIVRLLETALAAGH